MTPFLPPATQRRHREENSLDEDWYNVLIPTGFNTRRQLTDLIKLNEFKGLYIPPNVPS